MKAIVCTKYGPPDVLQLKEVEKPAPKDNEVLIAVHAASVNQYDWHLLTADVVLVRLMGGGLLKPKTRDPGLTWRGGWKRLAETCSSLGQVMRCLGTCPPAGMALLPSMYLFRKMQWH